MSQISDTCAFTTSSQSDLGIYVGTAFSSDQKSQSLELFHYRSVYFRLFRAEAEHALKDDLYQLCFGQHLYLS